MALADVASERKKIIVLGDSGAGKTALLKRIIYNNFDQTQATVGLEFGVASAKVNGVHYTKLEIWDTAGSEKFRSLAPLYMRDADGVIMVYAVDDPQSFESLEGWISAFKDCHSDPNGVAVVLVANKLDLNEAVPAKIGRNFAKNLKVPFFEVSAKEATNVETAFQTLVQGIIEKSNQKNLTDDRLSNSKALTALAGDGQVKKSTSWPKFKGTVSLNGNIRTQEVGVTVKDCEC
ncbi:ras-related protein Rab-13-like isoform X1 [Clavelina lepadiformis]|uniref:ras-related protein Rab-13-like isoform X1 n=1 Tax=Clavelina lepadiformis TaxID=159417 RepID=UPI0040437BB7